MSFQTATIGNALPVTKQNKTTMQSCVFACQQVAIETNCNCMHFLVVVWNKPSIEYYMRRGASDLSTEEGWHLFKFDKEQIRSLAAGE